MNSTTYLPTALDNVMPGGFRETILRGRPFNRIADILGTAGNAGMFSTAGDIAKYMQMMLNKGKVPGKKALLFSLEVIEEFLTVKKFKSYKNTRAFGW
jgi:CubicO group peptidase (beta-lactamase class C family)